VIHFLWSGLSQKEIAGDLGISHGRVRNILTDIYEKLGLADGKELSTLIHSHKILWPETGETGEVKSSPRNISRATVARP
jgi:hypothetical protein